MKEIALGDPVVQFSTNVFYVDEGKGVKVRGAVGPGTVLGAWWGWWSKSLVTAPWFASVRNFMATSIAFLVPHNVAGERATLRKLYDSCGMCT